MKEFDQIGKKTPYAESEEYIDDLVSKATKKAMEEYHPKTHTSHTRRWIAAAAIILFLVGIGITYFSNNNRQEFQQVIAQQQEIGSPIDAFLDSLTSEEVMMLAYYETEEIPEY